MVERKRDLCGYWNWGEKGLCIEWRTNTRGVGCESKGKDG